jgi:hypothetical protein
MKTEYFQIKNWGRYQTYKDRSPPWCKLHWEILTSEDWVMQTDVCKLTMVVCILVGTRHKGRVPNNPDYIKRIANLETAPNLNSLIECGFLEELQTVETALQTNETLETEAEAEVEAEKKQSKSRRRVAAAPATKKTARLPDSWQLDGPGTKYATTYGFNSDQRDQMAADFREYYTEGDGLSKKRTELGWRQSWQRWVRNQPNFSRKGKGNGKQPLDVQAVVTDLARQIAGGPDNADQRTPASEHHIEATEVENFDVPGDIVTVVDRGGVVISDPEWSEDPVEVVSDDHGDRARVPEGGPPELGESPESGSGVDTGGVSADSGGEGDKPRAPGGFEVPF